MLTRSLCDVLFWVHGLIGIFPRFHPSMGYLVLVGCIPCLAKYLRGLIGRLTLGLRPVLLFLRPLHILMGRVDLGYNCSSLLCEYKVHGWS
jgi:hypothetical protein